MQASNHHEINEIKEIIPNPMSYRYRKISIHGTSAHTVNTVINVSPDKLRPKEIMLQFPRKNEQKEEPINLKIIQQDYFKKYKIQTGIKSLLKAYDQTRKKNFSQGMQKLGLDVIQVKSFSTNSHGQTGFIYPPFKKIHSRKSMHYQQGKNLKNKDSLSPVKSRSSGQVKEQKQQDQQLQFRHLIQLTTSLTNFVNKQLSPSKQPKQITKKQSRTQQYLYKRLQGSQKFHKQQQNHIYDKRIKSYLDFLWKNMYAHNIYVNIDLKFDQLNARPRKIKAYIGLGNNGAMVRGLLRRRFWWSLVEERTADCAFIWTQLKVNEIFYKQNESVIRKPIIKNQQQWQEFEVLNKKNSKIKLPNVKTFAAEQFNSKLMHSQEELLYKKYFMKFQKQKQRQFYFKAQKNPKKLQIISPQTSGLIIHNHLQYNFYLGNKKALFYNLREYYSLIGKNVFNYVPLTFHIRKGMKDPEYNRFVDFYKKRAKSIKKQSNQEEQEGTNTKTRNIWIVKPGQNSNQGRGITVIDQIYELNGLLKTFKTDKQSNKNTQETQKTYIVQMYIDRPMLYNNRKFDIRHYMLISNFFGITRAYWYDEGYIRTSSYQFDIHNFAPEIHLTNDAVQKNFADYGKYEPSNKVSYQEFQKYLDSNFGTKKYSFKEQILQQMKQMATDAAKSVFNKIAPKNQMNNFQIFGLDFMIDKDFKPWLIQINTNPCLECVCPLLARIIPYMVETAFKLTIDLAFPPPTHYPNTAKHCAPMVNLQKFKYQLIFDSQYEGQQLTKLYKRIRSNIIQKIGQIQEDEQFFDEGKECKLDDYT